MWFSERDFWQGAKALCANMSETTLLWKLVYNIGAEETR